MSFGLEIRNANNFVIYTTESIAWNQVGTFYVAAGGILSIHIPAIVGKEAVFQRVFSGLPTPSTGATAPTVTVNTATGVVEAYGGDLAAYVMVFMR